MLFALLAAPVLAVRGSFGNVCAVVIFFLGFGAFSFLGDVPTRLRVDDDGLEYLAGGRDRIFLAWSEVGSVAPRRFRGWPAEDALVLLDHGRRPLLVAGVSMFERGDLVRAVAHIRGHVAVEPVTVLSPLTGKAGGRRRPELVPQRTSERFLASSIGGLVVAAAVAAALVTMVR